MTESYHNFPSYVIIRAVPKRNTGILFGLLGIVFIIAALFLWYRYSRRPIEVQAQRQNNVIEEYVVQTSAGRWIDTGVWVEPFRTVQAEGPDIFTLGINYTEREALLQDGKFYARLITVPCNTSVEQFPNDAWITNQGKVYFYAEKSIMIRFFIIGDTEKEKRCGEK